MKTLAVTTCFGFAMGIAFAQNATRGIELKVSSVGKVATFSVRKAPGKAMNFKDQAGLVGYLKRIYKEPVAIRLVVSKGTPLEAAWTAVKACSESGIQSVDYFGCIPPGCGILAGADPGQTRYAGQNFQVSKLNEILILNSQKC